MLNGGILMKPLKKLFTTLGITSILTTIMFSPVSAKTISNGSTNPNTTVQGKIDISEAKLGGEIILPDGAKLTPISRDEYISILAKEKNISIQQAYEIETRSSKSYLGTSALLSTTASPYYYYNYSKVFTYSKNSHFKAELVATLKVYSSGSFRQINDVMAISSRRYAGLYDYTWSQLTAWSDPQPGSSKFPTTSITLGASGYFEVSTSYSIDLSTDLPGFSVGGSSGGQHIYQSNTMFMSSSYSVY